MNKISNLQKYRLLYTYLKVKSFFTLTSNEINKEIMNIDGRMLEFVKDENKTFEICLDAVLNSNEAINYIPKSLSLKEKLTLHRALKKEEKTVKSPIKLGKTVLNRI